MGTPKLPEIAEQERTAVVEQLLEVVQWQQRLISALRDEVALLKETKRGRSKKARSSSGMEGKQKKGGKGGRRPGSDKRSKKETLPIHRTEVMKPASVPEGSELKGYTEWVVQDLVIQAQNTLYKLQRWRTPQGTYVEGQLPAEVKGHFGATLRSYVLYQYYQCHVTQPLLLEALREHGVDISAGQLNAMLLTGHDQFHQEKAEVLQAGLAVSSYIQVDDTGARHAGNSGHCTAIGNDLFAWFASRPHKSRIHFLQLLQAGRNDYQVNAEGVSYMRAQKLPKRLLKRLDNKHEHFADRAAWGHFLSAEGIRNERHVKIATEGALYGSLMAQGFNAQLVIISDDAGQFDVFGLHHALCWVHAERNLYTLEPIHDEQRKALDEVRGRVWDLYAELKDYRSDPSAALSQKLSEQFDTLVATKTCFARLNAALQRMAKNKADLLRVLDHPQLPLHTNAVQTDVREMVKRRKVSGGTRSELGREARDTFTSLKKTARKLGVSFWRLLLDRVRGTQTIEPLPALIERRCRDPVVPAQAAAVA